MKEYVLGFIFSEDLKNILTIQKNRPVEQAGLFNGIGGKVEPEEEPLNAISREVFEETNLKIPENKWVSLGFFGNDYFKIHLYTTQFDIENAQQTTDEKIAIINIHSDKMKNKELFVENTHNFLDLALKNYSLK